MESLPGSGDGKDLVDLVSGDDEDLVDLASEGDDDMVSSGEDFAADHFAEFFSVPRVVPFVRSLGGQANLSLDIMSRGSFSRDFQDPTDRAFALSLLTAQRPRMIGLTPPCTMFSQLTQRWNLKKLPEEQKRVKMHEAETLFAFAILLARTQHARGGFFFLEQPTGAVSWELLQQRLDSEPMSDIRPTSFVRFDQCRYGLRSPRGTPMKKSTKFWTNSPAIAEEFRNKTCMCAVPHQRIQGAEDGHQLSQWAQCFPAPLCAAIARCAMADHT